MKVTLPVVLHARPAAVLARAAEELGGGITVAGVDATSVLALLQLGAVAGQEVTVAAAGPDADHAVAVMVATIAGLGEGGGHA